MVLGCATQPRADARVEASPNASSLDAKDQMIKIDFKLFFRSYEWFGYQFVADCWEHYFYAADCEDCAGGEWYDTWEGTKHHFWDRFNIEKLP